MLRFGFLWILLFCWEGKRARRQNDTRAKCSRQLEPKGKGERERGWSRTTIFAAPSSSASFSLSLFDGGREFRLVAPSHSYIALLCPLECSTVDGRGSRPASSVHTKAGSTDSSLVVTVEVQVSFFPRFPLVSPALSFSFFLTSVEMEISKRTFTLLFSPSCQVVELSRPRTRSCSSSLCPVPPLLSPSFPPLSASVQTEWIDRRGIRSTDQTIDEELSDVIVLLCGR